MSIYIHVHRHKYIDICSFMYTYMDTCAYTKTYGEGQSIWNSRIHIIWGSVCSRVCLLYCIKQTTANLYLMLHKVYRCCTKYNWLVFAVAAWRAPCAHQLAHKWGRWQHNTNINTRTHTWHPAQNVTQTKIHTWQLDELLARINRRINEAEGLSRERRNSLGKPSAQNSLGGGKPSAQMKGENAMTR